MGLKCCREVVSKEALIGDRKGLFHLITLFLFFSSLCLCVSVSPWLEYFLNDMAMHIGQTAVDAIMTYCQLSVVDAE